MKSLITFAWLPLFAACASGTTWRATAEADARRAIAMEASLNPQKYPIRTLAILPLAPPINDTLAAPLGFALADMIANDIVKSGRLIVVERARIDALTRGVLATFLLMWSAVAVHAQGRGAGVVLQHWSLNIALGDSLRLVSAQQVVLPLSYQTAIGGRWSINAADTYTTGQANISERRWCRNHAHSRWPHRHTRSCHGSFFRDALSLAVGVNLPTGRTSLDQEELLALRVLASPAAGMPAPVLGSGFGATAGFIVACMMRGWAIAAGATYEQRGSYVATEQLTAAFATPTRIEPGPTGHMSLGATGTVGNGEMSFFAAGDVFGTDALQVAVDPTPVETRYRLGPMFNINWTYQSRDASFARSHNVCGSSGAHRISG